MTCFIVDIERSVDFMIALFLCSLHDRSFCRCRDFGEYKSAIERSILSILKILFLSWVRVVLLQYCVQPVVQPYNNKKFKI
jgi:hypothetical protein